MQAWVTGARGFIGRHLAAELARRGHRVHGIGHGAWLPDDRSAWGVAGWINSAVTAAGLDALAAAVGAPSVVFHLAGGSSVGASLGAPREDFARTVEASAELAEWVRTRVPQARVVAVSSAAVYGDAWYEPIPIGAPLRPVSPYGAHKAAMECLLAGHARSFGLSVAIVRLFSVYGPGLEKQLVWDLCCRLARGERKLRLGGCGDEQRDFIFVTDAVHALAAAAEQASPTPALFNGGTGRPTTVRELSETLVRLWPTEVELCFDRRSRAGDPRSLVADVHESSPVLPTRFIPLEFGLSRTIEAAKRRLLVG